MAEQGDIGIGPSGRSGPPARSSQTVLIVEDEALIALDLERRLQAMGLEVVGIADDESEALRIFREEQPDLVLMDVNLGKVVDGIEIAEQISAQSDVPVIFVTAYADDVTVDRAARVSPYGYVLKPFDERLLKAAVRVALERHAVEARSRVLAAAVNSGSLGIAMVDARDDSRVIAYCNRAFCTVMGVGEPARLMGQSPFFAVDPGDADGPRLAQALGACTVANGTVQGTRRDGTVFCARVLVSPVTSKGRVTHMVVFFQDVTTERAAQNAVVESQKMEMAGRLSAGIAHDFNNLLAVILAGGELALESVQDRDQQGTLEDIVHAAHMGSVLTRQLLTFARRTEHTRDERSEVDAAVMDAHRMLRRLAGEEVKLVVTAGAAGMFVRLDKTAVQQVLMNLVVNARDAMPRGGMVTVRTSVTGGDGGAQTVRIEVTDTGDGMDDETLQRIFQPLFTTKGSGVGTGLGLYSCQVITHRAGGRITAVSTRGVGTTFCVDLPVWPTAVP